jgi:murein DD-endopeptidase MepM/ murein hydrolase activator NlpD
MDDRHLTLIVVPHGDLETRSFVITYRKLKVLLVMLCVLGFILAIVVASWFPVAALAARVPALERELAQLESDRAKVVQLAKALSDVEAQYEKVRQLLGADAPTAGSPPTLPPLRPDTSGNEPVPEPPAEQPGPLSQAGQVSEWPLQDRGFVTRTIATGQARHPGIDIAVASNTRVRAAGEGTVRLAGIHEIYGKFIVIDHGAGVETVYGHANRLLVAAGDHVAPRQVIALSGSTGRSTAPHLHFEVLVNGTAVDPLTYIRQP